MAEISDQLLRDLLTEIEDYARAVFPHYDRKTKAYIWNDEVWQRSAPHQFEKVKEARAAIQQIGKT